eukprot:scaffold284112_cov28-Tisochrysis_lutea.AAC.8
MRLEQRTTSLRGRAQRVTPSEKCRRVASVVTSPKRVARWPRAPRGCCRGDVPHRRRPDRTRRCRSPARSPRRPAQPVRSVGGAEAENAGQGQVARASHAGARAHHAGRASHRARVAQANPPRTARAPHCAQRRERARPHSPTRLKAAMQRARGGVPRMSCPHQRERASANVACVQPRADREQPAGARAPRGVASPGWRASPRTPRRLTAAQFWPSRGISGVARGCTRSAFVNATSNSPPSTLERSAASAPTEGRESERTIEGGGFTAEGLEVEADVLAPRDCAEKGGGEHLSVGEEEVPWCWGVCFRQWGEKGEAGVLAGSGPGKSRTCFASSASFSACGASASRWRERGEERDEGEERETEWERPTRAAPGGRAVWRAVRRASSVYASAGSTTRSDSAGQSRQNRRERRGEASAIRERGRPVERRGLGYVNYEAKYGERWRTRSEREAASCF